MCYDKDKTTLFNWDKARLKTSNMALRVHGYVLDLADTRKDDGNEEILSPETGLCRT